MKRIPPLLLAASLLLSSCAGTPSLWGTNPTPTPEEGRATPFIVLEPLPVTSIVTPVPLSTATFTPTPTQVEPATSSVQTPASGNPGLEVTLTPTFDVAPVLYYAQSGDTLPALAARFNASQAEIRTDAPLSETGLINPGTLLVIPERIEGPTTSKIQLIPDGELVFSATAQNFNIDDYVKQAGGNLSHYREYLGSTAWTSGAQAITRLAFENSINPRLLLAVLEYESRWVRGQSIDVLHSDYPMGYEDLRYKGLFSQMVWAVNQLSIGYYGWRAGTLTELVFPDGSKLRINPNLNAGTVAIQYLFSRQHSQSQWAQIIDPNTGFPAVFGDMFGDPWARGDSVNPIFPPGLAQPSLVLPFQPKVEWSLTGGPHGAWEHDGALAAIDFAPSTDHGGCEKTTTWVTAAASGLIVRSEGGVVVQDLDGDGYEQTGWDLMYLHIAAEDRVPSGTWVEKNEHIGHASCEGGVSTGTHLHFVRKYNGEWVAADGPMSFLLSGWTIHQGDKPYEGWMTNGDRKVIADPVGQAHSNILRGSNDP